MFFWNKRPRWPPSPSVEDEFESLSRELHGLTKIGDKPGIEGVCARGSIDQYPVIIETLSLTSIVQTDTLGGYGHGSTSSVISSGPPTHLRSPNSPACSMLVMPHSKDLNSGQRLWRHHLCLETHPPEASHAHQHLNRYRTVGPQLAIKN